MPRSICAEKALIIIPMGRISPAATTVLWPDQANTHNQSDDKAGQRQNDGHIVRNYHGVLLHAVQFIIAISKQVELAITHYRVDAGKQAACLFSSEKEGASCAWEASAAGASASQALCPLSARRAGRVAYK